MDRDTLNKKLLPRYRGATPGFTESLRTIGIKNIPDGWLNLIAELDEELSQSEPAYEIGDIPGVDENFHMLSYCVISTAHCYDSNMKIVNNAKARSREICEVCGEVGEIREIPKVGYGVHFEILCDKHYSSKT